MRGTPEHMARFRDRFSAGEELAHALTPYRGQRVVVYALPRGGVPLGMVIADALGVPLHAFVARKVGHPLAPEFAVAAIAEDGTMTTNDEAVRFIDPHWFADACAREQQEAHRRRRVYEPDMPAVDPNATAIIVDDGIATGLTMQAAVMSLRKQGAPHIVVAVPVAPVDSKTKLEEIADEVVCLDTIAGLFPGVGAYYDHFPQLEDNEVISALKTQHRSEEPETV